MSCVLSCFVLRCTCIHFFCMCIKGPVKECQPFLSTNVLHYNAIKSCDIVFYCTLSSIPAYIDIQLCDL